MRKAVGEAFKNAGFSLRSDTWYLDAPETILIGNLQKSAFGDQYYLNLAVWLKVLGSLPFPKEHQSHVRVRATALVPGLPESLLSLQGFKGEDEAGPRRVTATLSQQVFPAFMSLRTMKGIAEALESGRLDGALVHKAVRAVLHA